MQDVLGKISSASKPNARRLVPTIRRCSNIPAVPPVSPKGAVAMHRNVVANTLQIKSWMTGLEEGKEVVLMGIPLFHVYGMVAGMNFAMANRCEHGDGAQCA
jgi:hypothetical protein